MKQILAARQHQRESQPYSHPYIFPRRSPQWGAIASRYTNSGIYDSTDFIPNVLPIGFPTNLSALIDLWNASFRVNFFSVRHRLTEIAKQNWHAVNHASIDARGDVSLLAREMLSASPRNVVCFVDDDDWFSPHLAIGLSTAIASGAHAIRWEGPIFDGSFRSRLLCRVLPRSHVRFYQQISSIPLLQNIYHRFVRATSRSVPMPVVPAGGLFLTNNYAITPRFVRDLGSLCNVIDHIEASMLFQRADLRILTIKNSWLSLTLKHPCSAGVIGHFASKPDPEEALRNRVKAFVDGIRDDVVPKPLQWAIPNLREARSLFRSAL